MSGQPIIYIVVFLVTLFISIWLRTKRFPSLELKNGDIMLAILVIVIIGIANGDVTSLAFGDLKAEFRRVSKNSVEKEVLPVRTLETVMKGSEEQIRKLQTKRPDGLVFKLRYDNYAPQVVCNYLAGLPSVKYIVVNSENNNQFELMFQASKLLTSSGCNTRDFVAWIRDGNIDQLNPLLNPLSRDVSILESTTKLDALEAMDKANSQFLPVLDNDKMKLKGVVERSALVSAMLAEITRSISQ